MSEITFHPVSLNTRQSKHTSHKSCRF